MKNVYTMFSLLLKCVLIIITMTFDFIRHEYRVSLDIVLRTVKFGKKGKEIESVAGYTQTNIPA